MAPNAIGRALVGMVGCFLMVAPAIAQQPKPKPVTPPDVIPGQKPPAAPAIPKGQPSNNATPTAATANGTKDAEIQPFLGDNLLGVAAVDLKTLDVEGWEKYMVATTGANAAGPAPNQAPPEDIKKMFARARKWTSGMTQAGADRLYVVFRLEDVPEMPPFVVIPLPRGSDGSALIALFNASPEKNQGFGARRIGEFVVAGGKPTLDRLSKELSSKPNADVLRALAEGGSAPLRFAFCPGDTPRQMLQGASATLPEELGGQPVTVVTEGLRWMAVSITAPAAPRFKLTIQARDAKAAEDLQTLAGKCEDALKAHASDWSVPFDVDKAVSLLTFHQAGDRLEISLAGEQTRELAKDVVGPVMARAWQAHQSGN